MRIGVPRETKVHEYRVGLVPAGVRELVHNGHTVYVETGAGAGVGLNDGEYRAAGGEIVPDADSVFANAGISLTSRSLIAFRMSARSCF